MMDLRIQRMLHQATGLDLSQATVDTAIRKRMKQRHIRDKSAYAMEVVKSNAELGALIDLVVVPETWFFRDPEAFSVAGRFALDIAESAGRPVRALSAPCATGEEPYSLAIAMRSAGIAPENFTIDAVDVSQQALRCAQRGVYQRNAFRGNEPSFRDRYFAQGSDGFELSPEIRKLVQFRHANLLNLEPPNGMAYDIIFCRNLLIYFDQATQAAAIGKLRSLLHDDGLLFCGYAEVPGFCLDDFTRAPFPNAFAVQKKKNVPRAAPVRATPPVSARARPRGTAGAATLPKPLPRPEPPPPETAAKQGNPDSLLERANRLADQGTIDDASEAFHAYLGLVPDSAHAHFMLGLLNEQRHDDKAAEVYLRRAVYLEPNHYDALCHLALLAERRGHDGTARNYRNRAARVFERRSQGLDQ